MIKVFTSTHLGKAQGDTTRAGENEIVYPGVYPGLMASISTDKPTNLVKVIEAAGDVESLGSQIFEALSRTSYQTRHGAVKTANTARMAARQILADAAKYEPGTVLAYVEPGRYSVRGRVVDGEWQAVELPELESAAEQQSMF